MVQVKRCIPRRLVGASCVLLGSRAALRSQELKLMALGLFSGLKALLWAHLWLDGMSLALPLKKATGGLGGGH